MKQSPINLEEKAWYRLVKVLFQFAIGLFVLFTIAIAWEEASARRYIGDRNIPMTEEMYLQSYSGLPLEKLQAALAEKYHINNWQPYENYFDIGKFIQIVAVMGIAGGLSFWVISRAFLYVVAGKK